MDGYGYPYAAQYPKIRPDGEYPDHGDGFGEYYGLGPLNEDPSKRASCSKYRDRKPRKRTKSRDSADKTKSTRSRSRSKSRSRSRSKSRSRSRSRSRSGSRSRSASRSRSGSSRPKTLNFKEPSILDAFRVLYLTPSKHKKSTTRYLATKKRQDRVQELLKSDGLGSKRWLFYPRSNVIRSEPADVRQVPGPRDNVDQRIRVDADFFRKYKKSKKIDTNAPIAKLKRWELLLYKKIGFVQAV